MPRWKWTLNKTGIEMMQARSNERVRQFPPLISMPFQLLLFPALSLFIDPSSSWAHSSEINANGKGKRERMKSNGQMNETWEQNCKTDSVAECENARKKVDGVDQCDAIRKKSSKVNYSEVFRLAWNSSSVLKNMTSNVEKAIGFRKPNYSKVW